MLVLVGLFCLIIGLFCLIIGLFCLIIGLFCLIRGRIGGEGPAGAHSQTSSLYAFLQQIYQGADFSECALQHTVGFYFLFYSVNKIHIHTLILTTYMAPEHLLFYIIIVVLLFIQICFLSIQHTVGAGTPTYMAPEQTRGKVYSEQCDIYSVGVVFLQVPRS